MISVDFVSNLKPKPTEFLWKFSWTQIRETDSYSDIQTQIRRNTILTLATKQLMIFNKHKLYLHINTF